MTAIYSVDQLCTAVEEILEDHLDSTMAKLAELLGKEPNPYRKLQTLQQVPSPESLSTAQLPGVAIAAAGIVDGPTYSRADRAHRVTWRIAVGVYERGKDHSDTQARVRDWLAGIRDVVLANRSLDGVAITSRWAGEQYDLVRGRDSSRTIAAGAVAFDVTAAVAAISSTAAAGDLPTVSSTRTTVSVTQPGGTP